jgi:hypothetical protein
MSHLYISSFNIGKSLNAYEKYFSIVKHTTNNDQVVKNGEKVIECLKSANEDIKKKQGLCKNQTETRKVYDEMVKKHIPNFFWEDLERPSPKYILDPNDPNIINMIKKTMAKKPQFKQENVTQPEKKEEKN